MSKKITDYQPLQRNPNKGNQRGVGILDQSVRELGAGRSILVDKNGIIIAGNHAQEAFVNAGIENVIEVETDGTQIVVVKRTDMDAQSTAGQKMAIMDNRAVEVGLEWDNIVLGELLEEIKASDGELDGFLADMSENQPTITPEPEEPEDEQEPLLLRVPDAVWGTDNDYGIPMLDLSMQATCLEAPFAGWGTMPRRDKMTGTYHFYVEDYRFEPIWKNPLDVANSACSSIVEPNFSVYDDMPMAVALWQVYRKRWLSRWFQSAGIRVFVDLNISHRHDNLRFLGVPRGWKAYCTRAYDARLDEAVKEYEQALEHSESESILFVCYGGGKRAEELSKQYGWIWYPDQQTKARVEHGKK